MDADKVLSNLLISWLSRSLSLKIVLRLRSMASYYARPTGAGRDYGHRLR